MSPDNWSVLPPSVNRLIIPARSVGLNVPIHYEHEMIDFRDHLEMLVNLKLQGSNTREQISEDLDSNIVNIRLLDGFYPPGICPCLVLECLGVD